MVHKKLNTRRRASSANQAILDMVSENIASGVWHVGTQLPTERELVTRFGIARNTVRKSLDTLEVQGKITRQVGRGAFVTDSGMPDVHAGPLAQFRTCSPADVMEVRLMLEPRAAHLAATRASMAELASMRECLAAALAARDVPTFEHWDGMLHKTIIGAVRNDLLIKLYDALNAVRNQPEWRMLKERTVTTKLRKQYHAAHESIVAALTQRDAVAAQERMRAHLIDVRSNLLGSS